MLSCITVNRNPVHFSSSFPAGLAEKLFFNSQCFYASGSYGYLLAQLLSAGQYLVLYTTGTIREEVSIELKLSAEAMICQVVLEQPVGVKSAQTGEEVLPSQSVTLLSASTWQGNLRLKANKTYSFLSVIYPLSIARQQLEFFPLLDNLKRKLAGSEPLYLPRVIYPLSVSLATVLYQLLHIPYVVLTKTFYHHLLALLLTEVLQSLSAVNQLKPLFTLRDVDRILSAKLWIDSHLDTHFTTAQIARKAGLNEYKLKKGFKKMYGLGVYGYLLQQRLSIARITLEQTGMPIKQIARRAGYKNESNFSIAFKRLYGMSPYRYRLQKKNR